MENESFKPLKEFGALGLTEESEIKFYVDEFKGFKYASIRTFLKREGYTGPTKAGVTLNPQLLPKVIETMAKLPAEPNALQDTELARFEKKMGTTLVVRITLYKDTTGVDLREWVEDGTYTGWSKKGVRIPYKDVKKAIELMREMEKFLAAAGPSKPVKRAAPGAA